MAIETPAIPASAGAADAKVSRDIVERAVNALLKWKDAQSKEQAPQLLPDDEFVYLNITLKKIPPKARVNPFRIALPHALHDQASSECCLIIDDRSNSNLTSKDAKKVIKSQDISVSKVLKLSKLKTDYKPFEAKRKLCDSYDVFLVDKRIVHFLPKLLGKHFFKKRKLPLPVDLTKKNWKEQIERACGSGLFFLRTGTCSVMKVGKRAMESGEIVDNVVEAINGVVEYVPKKWGGVRSLHLRLSGSVALPLYQGLPDMKLKIMGAKDVERGIGSKESSDDFPEAKDSGKTEEVGRKKRKGRLHEVRYMDVETGGSELSSDNEDGENETEKNRDFAIVKGNVEEESDEKENEMSKGDDLVPAKKGKKGKTQKGSDLSGEKGSKKVRKGENKEDKKQKKIKSSIKSDDESGKRKNVVGMKLKEVPTKLKSKRTKKSQ
ncbi:PREDICTED: ribosomal L1 domain-containing protein 1-like [Ipomoea nil]|uniref:ribosomal L1 domain-containing protein 1-like n=1 Tax=Ipomoea nil TaxID=35883 RepID=UPI000900BD7E|nr:PREDICTED: ribosomal L1 domain-containing protein 1-like [Ipomoea nil]